MTEILLLLLFGGVVAFWFDSRAVQEVAVARCRQACENEGFQFLDEVAPAWHLRLQRDANGNMRIRRVFTFDYSTPLAERRSGSIVMLGRTPILLRLDDNAPLHSRMH